MSLCRGRAWLTGLQLALIVAGCSSSGPKAHEALPEPASEPELLDPDSVVSEAIYEDVAMGKVRADALQFTPDYPLWSDGADKRRWVLLPDGEQIDTSDMDHWRFPLGTKFVKEFSLDGVRLETRVIEHVKDTGVLKRDLTLKVYVWNEEQTDARVIKDGVVDLFGTQHDVPKQKDCIACHVGEPSGTLGFSALQLSESGMLSELEARGLLSDPPGRSFVLPGTAVERAAIGRLHANCGHCHTEGTPAEVMRLRVLVSELDRPWSESQLYQTTLGQLVEKRTPRPDGFDVRVVPGDPERSALLYRMEQRNSAVSEGEQMPPLATELVDDAAVDAVRRWIAAMPRAESDAGEADAGEADAGVADVSTADAATASETQMDASAADAGEADAGHAGEGHMDVGEADADEADAETDTGEADAGEADAGIADASEADAGDASEAEIDAGEPDAGDNDGAAEASQTATEEPAADD